MESPDMKQIHPWTSIWTQPRKTLRAIIDRDPKRWVLSLAIVYGIVTGIVMMAYLWTNYPNKQFYHQKLFILTLLIVGAVLGAIHLYLGAWLYRLTGSWLGGKGNYTNVKCAVGWACYPFIIAGVFNILSSAFLPHPFIALFFVLLNAVAGIWGLIISFKLIGEAHQFSAWKAVLAVLIAFVLVFVVFMIIALIIPLLTPLFV